MKKLFFVAIVFNIFIFGCKTKGCKDPLAYNYDQRQNVIDEHSSCLYLDTNLTKRITTNKIENPIIWKNNGNANIDYIVSSQIFVTSQLIIEPDVTIAFEKDGGFVLDGGEIIAEGTLENKIIFKSYNDGWAGITTNSNNSKLILKNVNILGHYYFTSNNNGFIHIDRDCQIVLENVMLDCINKVTRGIKLYGHLSANSLFSNVVIKNTSIPFATNQGYLVDYLDQFHFIDNEEMNFIFANSTFPSICHFNNKYPIHFIDSDDIVIENFIADSGTVFLFQDNKLIVSQFQSNGTNESPVIFSNYDESYWEGIEITTNNAVEFNNTHLLGCTHWIQTVKFYAIDSPYFTFENSTINADENAGQNCGIKIIGSLSGYSLDGSIFINCESDFCPE